MLMSSLSPTALLLFMVTTTAIVVIIAHFTNKKKKTKTSQTKNIATGADSPDIHYQTMPSFLSNDMRESYARDVGILYETCLGSSSNITPSGNIGSCLSQKKKNWIQLQTNNSINVPGLGPYAFETQKCAQQFDACNRRLFANTPANNEQCSREYAECLAWAPTESKRGVIYPTTFPVSAIKS